MSVPGWFILGLPDHVIWDWAESRRMQRSEEETAALYRRLARQLGRAIWRAIPMLLIVSIAGCSGCIYGRDYTVLGTNEHVCLDP
jgi:hypothetical protein